MKLNEMINKLRNKDLNSIETLIIYSPFITDIEDEYMMNLRSMFSSIADVTVLNIIKMITIKDTAESILQILTNENYYSVLRHLEYDFDSVVYAIKK